MWSVFIPAVIIAGKQHSLWKKTGALCFYLNQAAGFSAPLAAADAVIMSLLALRSSRARSPLIHVSFKEGMINMWLQVGSRKAGDGWEWHFTDRFPHLLVWSICWAFLCTVPRQMGGFVQRHISFGAGTSQSSVSAVAGTNWINLPPTVWSCIILINFLRVLKSETRCN